MMKAFCHLQRNRLIGFVYFSKNYLVSMEFCNKLHQTLLFTNLDLAIFALMVQIVESLNVVLKASLAYLVSLDPPFYGAGLRYEWSNSKKRDNQLKYPMYILWWGLQPRSISSKVMQHYFASLLCQSNPCLFSGMVSAIVVSFSWKSN